MMPRNKAKSDPQISRIRSISPEIPFPERILRSLTEQDDYYYRRFSNVPSNYGSIQEEAKTSCCVAGEHFMTSANSDFIRKSLSMDSVVHVDISDINGDGDFSFIPISLRKCKRTIIAPYSWLLSFIGWRPWFQDSLNRFPRLWKYFNCVYPFFIVVFIISYYVFQVINCQGKFNIHKDIQPSIPPPTPKEVNMKGNCTLGKLTFGCNAKYIVSSEEVTAEEERVSSFCQHIIPTYVVPSFVHFLAFAYGFYHFRLTECEQLYSLMERVFLQSHSTPGLQNSLIRNSRLFFIAAVLWLVCQVAIEILYNFTFPLKLERWDPPIKYTLLGLKLLGCILVQSVNVAVTMNYCVQCETLILYIKGICLRLHEKSLEIRAAMHEILGVREYISSLNGNVAKMMGLAVINFTELTILGTALLFLNRDSRSNVLCYRVLFPFLWLIALIVPLIQAARLTRVGSKIRQISFETRVFGYQACSQIELDSFVLFVNGATLRSKLFGVTIRSSTVIMTVGLSVFILLTLMVIDVLTVSGYSQLF